MGRNWKTGSDGTSKQAFGSLGRDLRTTQRRFLMMLASFKGFSPLTPLLTVGRLIRSASISLTTTSNGNLAIFRG